VAPSIRKKLAITSPTSGGRSVGIVRSRTQTMEFSFASDEQDPACCTRKMYSGGDPTLSQLRRWRSQENVARVVYLSSAPTDGSEKAPNPDNTVGSRIV
jgi:hypothetical protein